MARLAQELRDMVAERIGRFNTDVLVGWEAGTQGKQRIDGKLFERHPPDYFVGPRRDDWYAGYRAGLAHRQEKANNREVVFVGENAEGSVTIRRKGGVLDVAQSSHRWSGRDATARYTYSIRKVPKSSARSTVESE